MPSKDSSELSSPLIEEQRLPHVPYYVDDTERAMQLWRKRLATYFPNEVRHIREYKLRVVHRGTHTIFKSLLLLMDDDTLKEFTIDSMGCAELKQVTE